MAVPANSDRVFGAFADLVGLQNCAYKGLSSTASVAMARSLGAGSFRDVIAKAMTEPDRERLDGRVGFVVARALSCMLVKRGMAVKDLPRDAHPSERLRMVIDVCERRGLSAHDIDDAIVHDFDLMLSATVRQPMESLALAPAEAVLDAYGIRSNVYFERAEAEYHSNPRSLLRPVREPTVALLWDVAGLSRHGYRLRSQGVRLPHSLVELPALDLSDVEASLERAAEKLIAAGIAERRI